MGAQDSNSCSSSHLIRVNSNAPRCWTAMDPENPHKAILQPRRPGEGLKVAETVLKRRDNNLKANAERAAQVARIRKNQREYKKGKLKIVRAERLIKQNRLKRLDRERLL